MDWPGTLETVREVDIETRRAAEAPVHRTTIWVVVADGDVYVRSEYGWLGVRVCERVLGRALKGNRDSVVIASKWGNLFDEQTRIMDGTDPSPGHLRTALEASLRRLDTDWIDLYQLHLGQLEPHLAGDLLGTLEELVEEGKICWYGWSTDDAQRAKSWAIGAHCTAIQHEFSLLNRSVPEVLEVCERANLASVNRGPLAMGLLTGKYTEESKLGPDDVRGISPAWMSLYRDGSPAPEYLARVAAVQEALTSDGRTLAQGALGWLWARSDITIPIPGCRTVAQVEQNAGALTKGPLSPAQVKEIDALLADD
jgi:aryl-alcohol dehydrogenase-like predicted oxidoreductase